jgi:pimeloyl-ACP methyl ester carboxylesterase
VRDLRRALGIDEWNIFGISYGTTVALEVLRADGEAVRSAVIDSVFPTDIADDAERQRDIADRVFGELFAGCGADPQCGARYPNLEADFDALVADWNAVPFELSVAGPEGPPVDLVITGNDVVAGAWNGMYDGEITAILPSVVETLGQRSPAAEGIVGELARRGWDQLSGAAEGVAVGVNCADRQRLAGGSEAAVLAEAPMYASLLTLGPDSGPETCDLWGVAPVDPAFNEPVSSDVPTLILGDRYDPVTPPADGERAAATLSASTFVATSGFGHGITLRNDCTQAIFGAFVADPEAPVDSTCLDAFDLPQWSV